jgi:diadenosine tetraphosphatase ApaH/serine/threonine PP2A family protein phosphatase
VFEAENLVLARRMRLCWIEHEGPFTREKHSTPKADQNRICAFAGNSFALWLLN